MLDVSASDVTMVVGSISGASSRMDTTAAPTVPPAIMPAMMIMTRKIFIAFPRVNLFCFLAFLFSVDIVNLLKFSLQKITYYTTEHFFC